MNGREIEHLLSVIDESILRGKASLRAEIMRYLCEHEHEVIDSLQTTSKVVIPTTSGPVELLLPQLEALVA